MSYDKKPKMIFFDVGGTLFDDGKCNPADGFEKLRHFALNSETTNKDTLYEYWNKFLNDISGIKSKSGITLETPLASVIRYATTNAGLVFDIPMAVQEEIFDRFNSSRKVIDGITELLSELNSSGIRTAVISNNMMSGESLFLALKRWIPSSNFEFCLTSSDILFTKPSKNIFNAALKHAKVEPDECWYCGDSIISDIYGSYSSGMSPILFDVNSLSSLEFLNDEYCEKFLVINNWNALKEYINNISA